MELMMLLVDFSHSAGGLTHWKGDHGHGWSQSSWSDGSWCWVYRVYIGLYRVYIGFM